MKFEIPLLGDRTRPFIKIDSALGIVDTGSSIPMCGLPEDVMRNKYGAEFFSSKQTLKGFGGRGEQTSVLRFRHFAVGPLEFKGIPFLARDLSEFGVDFVISACMFGKDTVLTIDRRNDLLIVEMPDIVFHSQKLWRCDTDGWHIYDYIDGQGWTNLAYEISAEAD